MTNNITSVKQISDFLDKIKDLDEYYNDYRGKFSVTASTIIGISTVIMILIIRVGEIFSSPLGVESFSSFFFGLFFMLLAIVFAIFCHFFLSIGYKVYANHKLAFFKMLPEIKPIMGSKESDQELGNAGTKLFIKSNWIFSLGETMIVCCLISFLMGILALSGPILF